MDRLKLFFISYILFNSLLMHSQNNMRFYNEVVNNDEKLIRDEYPESHLLYTKNEFKNVDLKVFQLLKNELKEVNQIYYAYLPEPIGVIPGDFFRCFVYDMDNYKVYFIQQKTENSSDLELVEVLPYHSELKDKKIKYNFFRANFLIENMKKNDCETINDLDYSSEHYAAQVIYSVNLKEQITNKCIFNFLNLYKKYLEFVRI